MAHKILIIDDESNILFSLSVGLQDKGYITEIAQNSQETIEKLNTFNPDLLLLDLKLENESGLELAKKIKEIDNDVLIIIMTAHGGLKTAIEAIKAGVSDYIHKPLDLDEVDISIGRALKEQSMEKKLQVYEHIESNPEENFISESKSMHEVKKRMTLLSQNDSVTVLIKGETGTGKELVAKYIHKNSKRRDFLMLSINCAAIPVQLLESELFGFEKNAFTGAGTSKKGLLELAHKGTLFLDEFGEIPRDIQTKLLRFLETRKFQRVGGLRDIEVDIRIIAATNKNLEKAVENNEFRKDLFYRINVIPINIPPLRKRLEDIILLTNYFIKLYAKQFGKDFESLSKDAEEFFKKYSWPGNIRELKNIIERMVILNDGKFIETQMLPNEITGKVSIKAAVEEIEDFEEGFSLSKKLESIEKEYIKLALQKTDGNITKAGNLLGLTRFTLRRKMDRYFNEY